MTFRDKVPRPGSVMELRVPPVAWFLVAIILAWVLAVAFPFAGFSFQGQLLSASLVLLAGGLVGIAGVRAFLQAGTTANPMDPDKASRLVSSGMYRYSRNPMYLALLLALLAWGIWLGNLLALLTVPAFVAIMNRLQIRPEERALQRLFGDEYLEYTRQTRRWI